MVLSIGWFGYYWLEGLMALVVLPCECYTALADRPTPGRSAASARISPLIPRVLANYGATNWRRY